jgi:hypothetical protein
MRMTLGFVLLIGITVVSAQQVKAPPSNFLADSVIHGARTKLTGHVRIAACSIVTADEAVIGENGTDIELGGAVRMKLTHGIDPLRVR